MLGMGMASINSMLGSRGQGHVQQLHGTVFLGLKTVFSRLKHDAHMRSEGGAELWEMTMLSQLCLLAVTVTIVTLVTPVAVPIMWNKIEGSAAAKEPNQ
jgi:hypothetical protein